MKELQPINDYVLLKLEETQTGKTKGGIIIPETVKEGPAIAEVVNIGNIEDSLIETGDKVIYKKFSGTEIEFEGQKYILVPYTDILAKIVETEEI